MGTEAKEVDLEVEPNNVKLQLNGNPSVAGQSLNNIDEDDAIDFFSRARDNQFDFELEEQRRREKRARKLARRKAKEEAKQKESESAEPDLKKRRISREEPASNLTIPEKLPGLKDESKSIVLLDSDDDKPVYSFERSDTQPVPSQSVVTSELNPEQEENDDLLVVSEKNEPVQSASYPESEEDDPYFRELADKARAKANSQSISVSQDEPASAKQALTPVEETDPNARITVVMTSPMENEGYQRVAVIITMNRALREARTQWCIYNNIRGNTWDNYIMLLNKKRVWDVTTPEGLGYRGTSDGERIYEPGSTKSKSFKKVVLHLEVLTEEFWSQLKAQEATAKAKENDDELIEDVPIKKDDGSFKVTLRSKDKADQRLRIRPDTSIKKLAFAFRKFHKLTEDANIVVHFDGDELDKDETATSLGLSAEDTLEVYIK